MEDFEEIYGQYFSTVYQFALGLCRDPNLAEEITQETFFKALKRIDSFRGDSKLSTWLCQIARNTWYAMMKRRRGQADVPLELLPSQEDLEERFADRETAQAIHRALHRLREPYKEVFWLRSFGELSFAQIGLLFEKAKIGPE